MKNIIEFHNFAHDSQQLFADLHYNGKYALRISEDIEFIRYHEYDSKDEVCTTFKKAAIEYLKEHVPVVTTNT